MGEVTGSTGGFLFSFTDQPVTKTAQTITFSQSLAKKYSDSPFTLTASASSGLVMTYSSSNTGVATANNNVLIFHATGTSDITARQAGTANWAPARYVRTLTVAMGDQTITFNVLPAKTTGDPDFNPGATASSGLPVSYSSDNTGVSTIAGGMIHIVGAGTAVITASQPGDANYNAATDVLQTLTVDIPTGFENPVISQNRFKIYTAYNRINIQTLAEEWDGETGSVRIIDIAGKTVFNLQPTEFRKNSLIQFGAPASKGIYIVDLKAGVLHYVGKVVIR
jgi:hypothetical protein